VLQEYDTREDRRQVIQAAARDLTCIPVLLHSVLGARLRLASVTDPVRHREQWCNLRTGLFILNNLTAVDTSLHPFVGAAVAAAPPDTLDALAEWITQPGPSGANVETSVVPSAWWIAASAAICDPAAAAALARRRSVVRSLVSAVVFLTSPDSREVMVDILRVAIYGLPMFAALFKASSEDVMRALAAGQPGRGRDSDDLVQRLRGWVVAAVARGGLDAAALRSAEAVLAALAEGEEWLKTQVDQHQQQPGGCRACAGCGKTAADEGVVKLRRCNGCPRGSALWFCSVACQKAVWVGGHRRECPRLDTAAQHDPQR